MTTGPVQRQCCTSTTHTVPARYKLGTSTVPIEYGTKPCTGRVRHPYEDSVLNTARLLVWPAMAMTKTSSTICRVPQCAHFASCRSGSTPRAVLTTVLPFSFTGSVACAHGNKWAFTDMPPAVGQRPQQRGATLAIVGSDRDVTAAAGDALPSGELCAACFLLLSRRTAGQYAAGCATSRVHGDAAAQSGSPILFTIPRNWLCSQPFGHGQGPRPTGDESTVPFTTTGGELIQRIGSEFVWKDGYGRSMSKN